MKNTKNLLLSILLIFSTWVHADQPYIGEIRIFAGNFAPQGWMFCNGQLLSIAENDVLFNLIGTTYGGDGQNTFALPDMRGRVPLHNGNNSGYNFVTGEQGGVETVTLTNQQIPNHGHQMLYNKAEGDAVDPAGRFPAASTAGLNQYGTANGANLHSASVSVFGGSQPHENMQPYLACNYIISMYGIYPSQTKTVSKYDDKFINLDGTVTNYTPTKGNEPYLTEISMFAFNYAPRGYAQCNGQLLPINQNQAVFSLLGTTYGGNGQINFALPNIQGKVPVHYGSGPGMYWTLGQQSGELAHTVTIQEMPTHNHQLSSYNAEGNSYSSQNTALSISSNGMPAYSSAFSDANSGMFSNVGGSQPHLNMQPYASINFCIALQGIFPSSTKDERETGDKGADSFVAEIAIFPFNFTPRNYAPCEGQLLQLSQNSALFALLGTTYGGNGQSNFALPNLMGRAALHTGGYSGQGPGLSMYDLGQTGGSEYVTLLNSEIPMHTHMLASAGDGSNSNQLFEKTFGNFDGGYTAATPNTQMNPQSITTAGGSQPHNNLMPSIALNFCIAMYGIFPSHGKAIVGEVTK